MFFIGFILGSILFSRLGDLYGRKKFFIMGNILQTLGGVGILVSSNLYFGYSMMLLIGIASPNLVSIGYNYLMEFIPLHRQAIISGIIISVDSVGSAAGALTF
jgi:MFS family permease